jgi:hypothetical protein
LLYGVAGPRVDAACPFDPETKPACSMQEHNHVPVYAERRIWKGSRPGRLRPRRRVLEVCGRPTGHSALLGGADHSYVELGVAVGRGWLIPVA